MSFSFIGILIVLIIVAIFQLNWALVYSHQNFYRNNRPLLHPNPDGTKMYIVGWLDNTVYQYTLSTPWDVTSASLTTTFSTSVLPARNFY